MSVRAYLVDEDSVEVAGSAAVYSLQLQLIDACADGERSTRQHQRGCRRSADMRAISERRRGSSRRHQVWSESESVRDGAIREWQAFFVLLLDWRGGCSERGQA